ncbi:pectinesterase family protein [Brachybacterium phenoliresistens]|uniref:pectinesterase family protein n=1 Tax=Brachybacterium phenoliresistens TaxID=396014 RepID=UPI0031E1A71F
MVSAARPVPMPARESSVARGSTAVVGRRVGTIASLTLAIADPAVTEIVIEPGVYVEHVTVARRAQPLVIRSSTGRAEDVTLTFSLHQGARDRTGMPVVQDCATLTIDADDISLCDLTVVNGFDKRLHPDWPDTQALALRTRGDRILVQRCRLLGQQDTVLLDAPGWASVRRVHLRDCEIEGDVDFVYGRATALIEGGEIRSMAPGYVLAPSTARENPRGILVHGARLTCTDGVPSGSVKLGRPWHPGGKPDAVGQGIISRCELGPHIDAEPWAEMGGFAWQDARFAEYGNTGPGAGDRSLPTEDSPDPATWLDVPEPEPGRRPRVLVLTDSPAGRGPADRAPGDAWGLHLTARIAGEVAHHEVAARGAALDIVEEQLDAALDEVLPGDLVLIGFGNPEETIDEARGADVVTAYPSGVRRCLVGVRARGGRPVLLTPIERRRFEGGRAVLGRSGCAQMVRTIAAEEEVPLIDLSQRSVAMWDADGEGLSPREVLHAAPEQRGEDPGGAADSPADSPRRGGAEAECLAAGRLAAAVADELHRLGLLP